MVPIVDTLFVRTALLKVPKTCPKTNGLILVYQKRWVLIQNHSVEKR